MPGDPPGWNHGPTRLSSAGEPSNTTSLVNRRRSGRSVAGSRPAVFFDVAFTRERPVKKEEAVEKLERAGNEINDLYSRAWSTALYPTQHGWPTSVASAAMIPVLSFAL